LSKTLVDIVDLEQQQQWNSNNSVSIK
jgi:hypothetical protein